MWSYLSIWVNLAKREAMWWLSILALVGSWQVQEADPFRYGFVVALYRNGAHICNGALYKHQVAMVPSICTYRHMSNAKVELFRHDLSQTIEEETRRSYGLNSTAIYKAYPQSVDILAVHTTGELAFLKLDIQTEGGGGLWYQIYPGEKRPVLIGWTSHSTRLSRTSLPTAASNLCKLLPVFFTNKPFKLCFSESPTRSAEVKFKLGTPLVDFAGPNPKLIGLLLIQHQTTAGSSVAVALNTGLYAPAIESQIGLVFGI
ncbi:hypothetical protein DSO57_1007850 [Entomophthora muscae]|uniref:Uncharacterized protein n=1 Tax=Entomophthora muscae TaxID=34485 RepID=A0ACC2RYF9_9FUNG|nr:hypothetical protein DSO57_1007850 [Entomophthora muscae]